MPNRRVYFLRVQRFQAGSKTEKLQVVRYDVIFFLGGVPSELMIRDKHLLIATIQESFRDSLNKLGESVPEFQRWITRWPRYAMAVFRYDVSDREEAFERAYEALAGICDVYSLLLDNAVPSICPVVKIRKGEALDATIHCFSKGQSRVTSHSADGATEKRWKARREKLLGRFLQLFDVLGNADARLSSTEIGHQLKLSLKMFSHGCRASNVGIEFLCKFSALEGLVCGGVQNQKQKLLKERLGPLFTNVPSVDTLIARLWKLRCEASHQSKAFTDEFVQANVDVEFLLMGTVDFMVSHLNQANTIEDVWSRNLGHILAEEVILQPDFMQGRMVKGWIDTGILSNGIGRIVDQQFA